MERTSSPSRRAGLALAFSLAAHALLVVPLIIASAGAVLQNDRPVAVGAVQLDEGRLILDGPATPRAPRPGPTASPPSRGEESEAFVATVIEPPRSVSGPSVGAAPEVHVGTLPGSRGPAGEPGTGAGPGGGTGPAARGLLTAPVPPKKVVYVIDRSVSMGLGRSPAWDVARAEVRAALATLPPEARFQVVLYNRQAEPLTIGGRRELIEATPANREEALRLLEAMRPEGGTDHEAALRRALALEPDTIFLVTDADDLTPQQVRAVTQINHGRSAIHAVELRPEVPSRPDAPLPTLARLNRGTHRRAAPLP